MKQLSIVLMIVGALAFLSFTADSANFHMQGFHKHVSISDRDRDIGQGFSCEERGGIWSDDLPGRAQDEENQSFPNQALRIKGAHNGGIHVVAYDGAKINVKVCKSAVAHTDAIARSFLNSVKLTMEDGELTVRGPMNKFSNSDDEDYSYWNAIIVVQAPRNAELSLSTENGGISLFQVAGSVQAETHNGGVSMNETSGKVRVETKNGGVNIKDCGGDVHVQVQNGGVELQLGSTWNGAGLEAHTQNGGVNIAIPKDLATGIEVRGSMHSSIRCHYGACDTARKDWDERDKVIRLGSNDHTSIVVTTVNGGVNITERGHKEMEY